MRRAALVLLLLPVLAGCGGGGAANTGDFSGEERNVADTIAEFSDAAGRNEESEACADTLSASLRETVAEGGEDCPAELEKVFEDAQGGTIEIDDITIAADRTSATADVSIADGDEEITSTFELVDEDGDWRIDSFGTASRA